MKELLAHSHVNIQHHTWLFFISFIFFIYHVTSLYYETNKNKFFLSLTFLSFLMYRAIIIIIICIFNFNFLFLNSQEYSTDAVSHVHKYLMKNEVPVNLFEVNLDLYILIYYVYVCVCL